MPEAERLPDERTKMLLERLPSGRTRTLVERLSSERTRMFLVGAMVGMLVGGFFATVFLVLVILVLSWLGYMQITVQGL